jgi:hypothetical protein
MTTESYHPNQDYAFIIRPFEHKQVMINAEFKLNKDKILKKQAETGVEETASEINRVQQAFDAAYYPGNTKQLSELYTLRDAEYERYNHNAQSFKTLYTTQKEYVQAIAKTFNPHGCSICLSETGADMELCCGHMFHHDCVKPLTDIDQVCPKCGCDVRYIY